MKTYLIITASIVSAVLILVIIAAGIIWATGIIRSASPDSQWLVRERAAEADCERARIQRVADFGCRIRACEVEGMDYWDYHEAGGWSPVVRDAKRAYSGGEISYAQLCSTVGVYWQAAPRLSPSGS